MVLVLVLVRRMCQSAESLEFIDFVGYHGSFVLVAPVFGRVEGGLAGHRRSAA
jgi:hypothetical protein